MSLSAYLASQRRAGSKTAASNASADPNEQHRPSDRPPIHPDKQGLNAELMTAVLGNRRGYA